jgi:hypothetical protein
MSGGKHEADIKHYMDLAQRQGVEIAMLQAGRQRRYCLQDELAELLGVQALHGDEQLEAAIKEVRRLRAKVGGAQP